LVRFGNLHFAAILCAAVGGCATSPEPLSREEFAAFGVDKFSNVTREQEPVLGSIDLYDAIARAIKYNLDHRVEIMQAALKLKELNLASYQGLPNVVAGSGYAGRSNINASSSRNVATGAVSLVPSTSQDRDLFTGDLAFSWSILDFGLSYIRAKQAADQALVAEELRRKIVVRLVEDVRTAYWRAVASERLLVRLRALEGRTRQAIANARQLYQDRQTSPLTGLTYERELVDIKREIQRLEGELTIARHQLAALMNVNPAVPFRLSGRRGGSSAHRVAWKSANVVRIALENRPELRELAYRIRITQKEGEAALLELLPNITGVAGLNFDSNSFLVNQNWISWSAKASWNLLRLFQYPAKSEVIDAQERLLNQRALAVTMAIILQVHVSRTKYAHALRELQTASEGLNVQRRLLAQMRASAGSERVSEQTLIREEMNTLISEVRYDLAFANVENAYAAIYASLGLDPLPPGITWNSDLRTITVALRRSWVARGTLPKPATPITIGGTPRVAAPSADGEPEGKALPGDPGLSPGASARALSVLPTSSTDPVDSAGDGGAAASWGASVFSGIRRFLPKAGG
jgi:outer membrane protein TolC